MVARWALERGASGDLCVQRRWTSAAAAEGHCALLSGTHKTAAAKASVGRALARASDVTVLVYVVAPLFCANSQIVRELTHVPLMLHIS
jgi:hypothetical protein